MFFKCLFVNTRGGVSHLHPIILPTTGPICLQWGTLVTGPRSLPRGSTPVPGSFQGLWLQVFSGWYPSPNFFLWPLVPGPFCMVYPNPGQGDTSVPGAGYFSASWGILQFRWGTLVQGGYRSPQVLLSWGTPTKTGLGYPSSGQYWGSPRTGYAWTCYATGGTPLAASRRKIFLLLNMVCLN